MKIICALSLTVSFYSPLALSDTYIETGRSRQTIELTRDLTQTTTQRRGVTCQVKGEIKAGMREADIVTFYWMGEGYPDGKRVLTERELQTKIEALARKEAKRDPLLAQEMRQAQDTNDEDVRAANHKYMGESHGYALAAMLATLDSQGLERALKAAQTKFDRAMALILDPIKTRLLIEFKTSHPSVPRMTQQGIAVVWVSPNGNKPAESVVCVIEQTGSLDRVQARIEQIL